MDDAMSQIPDEPPPEVWDLLPVEGDEERMSAREDLGYAPPPPLKAALEAAAARAEPAMARGHTCAVCNRSYPVRSFGECVWCQGERNARLTNALAAVVRELKGGNPNAERERHLVKQLHELGHPDPKGLLDALAARRLSGGRARGGL